MFRCDTPTCGQVSSGPRDAAQVDDLLDELRRSDNQPRQLSPPSACAAPSTNEDVSRRSLHKLISTCRKEQGSRPPAPVCILHPAFAEIVFQNNLVLRTLFSAISLSYFSVFGETSLIRVVLSHPYCRGKTAGMMDTSLSSVRVACLAPCIVSCFRGRSTRAVILAR